MRRAGITLAPLDGAEAPGEDRRDRIPDGAPASLVLEDGAVFPGRAAGALSPTTGEAVFTTAMGGYPESMTDPSYRGQLLVFTYPEIGIHGVPADALESGGIYARALVVHHLCRHPSLAPGSMPLLEATRLAGRGVLEGVDTRAVARYLRIRGTMRGALVAGVPTPEEARAQVAAGEVADTSPRAAGLGATSTSGERRRVGLLDMGVKDGIRAALTDLGVDVITWDASRGAAGLLALEPDGILLSNGPGDPATMDGLVDVIRDLLGKAPLMGVCLGHQLLARALGARTERLKFGHRGVNHPVHDLGCDRVYHTSQNHGYAVSREVERLEGVRITHVHAGDGSVEGIACPRLSCRSVQFHPEARPGPEDASFLFEEFLATLPARPGGAS